MTQSQNLVASEGRSGPTVAGKRKIEEVTRGQSEADGAEVGVNQSFTQQRMFGGKVHKRGDSDYYIEGETRTNQQLC